MNKILQTLGLVILIAFTVALIVCCFVSGNHIWGYVFGGIALWIVGWEIYGTFFGFIQPDGKLEHRTISQMFWKFKEKHPKWAIVLMVLFSIAMAGLVVHLLA